MKNRIFKSQPAILALAFAFLAMEGCKTTNRSDLDSGPKADSAAGMDFMSMLVGQVEKVTATIRGNAPQANQQNAAQGTRFRAFIANEKLAPYASSASDIDSRRNKELSLKLANAVRGLLADWYNICSRDKSMQTEWAYPALCRDFSKSQMIDEAADFNLIAEIVREVERTSGMPAHIAIFGEIRYVSRANQVTLDKLSDACAKLPLERNQSDKIVEIAKSMPDTPLMTDSEIAAVVREGLISREQLRYLEGVVAPATEILRGAMETYKTELDLYLHGQAQETDSKATAEAKWAYSRGRRSVITSDFYQRTLRPYENAGVYDNSSNPDYLDFESTQFPQTNACASLVFKKHHDAAMAAFVQRHLPAIAASTAGQLSDARLATLLITRVLGISPGRHLGN